MTMEGPQFSTLAESKLYKENWKCDVIGMTNMPEAKLAKEAESATYLYQWLLILTVGILIMIL